MRSQELTIIIILNNFVPITLHFDCVDSNQLQERYDFTVTFVLHCGDRFYKINACSLLSFQFGTL